MPDAKFLLLSAIDSATDKNSIRRGVLKVMAAEPVFLVELKPVCATESPVSREKLLESGEKFVEIAGFLRRLNEPEVVSEPAERDSSKSCGLKVMRPEARKSFSASAPKMRKSECLKLKTAP